MGERKDSIIGKRFGMLVVISKQESHRNPCGKINTRWLCKCDCGNTTIVERRHLVDGTTKSCGCLRIAELKKQYEGKKFGRLTVLKWNGTIKDGSGHTSGTWLCKCDCGNEVVVRTHSLSSGTTTSCGCLQKEVARKNKTKHGGCNERLYRIWRNMIYRCNNPNGDFHSSYYDKGITVCDEWMDYGVFREWAIKNGYDENAKIYECTIDRIDNDGNYCPENCRWVDMKTQALNTSKNHYITYNGETKTLTQWAECLHINVSTLYARLKNGWPLERALTPHKYHKNWKILEYGNI